MKKILSMALALAFVLSATSVIAAAKAANTTKDATTKEDVQAATEKTLEEKANDTCTAQKLDGTKLEQCVNAELKKLQNEQQTKAQK